MPRKGNVLILIGLCTALFCTISSGETRGGSFTFAVIGDRTGGAVPGVFEQVLEEVSFLGPDLIITVGDHIEGYEADSATIEAEWNRIVDLMDHTGIEYHLTAGNHDIWDEQSRSIYRRRFGNPDTSFRFMNSLFVVIDVSTYYGVDDLPAGKIDWLRAILKAAEDVTSIFVFYHKPFWCEDFSSGKANLLHEILRQHPVKAVFTGHYHRHFYTVRDGIEYCGVSSSGGSLPPGGRMKGSFFSYLLVKVDEDDLAVKVVEPGFTLPPDIVTFENARRISEIEADAVRLSELRVDDSRLEGSRKVTVTIENRSETTLRDTATWIVKGGWTVEPLRDYVEVPPNEIGTLTAFVYDEGDLFPVPVISLSVPCDGGKVVEVNKALNLKRLTYATRVDSSVRIDGSLNDQSWLGVPGQGRYFRGWGRANVVDSTLVKVCYDSDSLYIGIEAVEGRADSLAATAHERDEFLGYDDYITVLLEPVRHSEIFYEISVNPIGTVFDKKVEVCPFGTYVLHPEWDAAIDVGAEIVEDRWIVELAVPLTALGVDAARGSEWGFNFRRMHRRQDVTSDFQTPFHYDSDCLGVLAFK